jgi:catechol 2,3-dioxygenase-like lactoylglutathione lyase family enzyme
MAALTGPIRRTTLVVRDMERSIAFYRDLLGWEVSYDMGDNPQKRPVLGIVASHVRVVVLKADPANDVGMIGLIGFQNPQTPFDAAPASGPARPGDAYIFLTTLEFDEVYGRLMAYGSELVMPFIPDEERGAQAREFAVRDPDGVIVTIIDRAAPSPAPPSTTR